MSIATSPLAWQFTWMPARCTRSTHALQVLLRLGDVALVAVLARVGKAQRHRPLGEGAVEGVLARCAELDPLVAEAGLDAARDHVFEHLAAGFVADSMEQLAASAHVLNRRQVAAFVMHARQPVAHELLGDVRDAVALAWARCSGVNVGRVPT